MCVWVVLYLCFDCIIEEVCDRIDNIRGEIEENKSNPQTFERKHV